jgi:hypothetical protein
MAPTPTELDPIAVTLKVTSVLDSLRVAYFIGGSLASSFHGMVRTTQDADIIARLRKGDAEPLTTALQDEFFVDAEMIARAIAKHASFNILHKETMFKVDVFVPIENKFTEQQFDRSRSATLSLETDAKAMIASPEDTILAKLDWYKQGGQTSERQWRDILGLLEVQKGSLEIDYLKKTAAQLGVAELLSSALQSF